MVSNSFDLNEFVAVFLWVYLLHSTAFLLITWLVVALLRVRRHALREAIWKVAAVAPFLSSVMAVSSGQCGLLQELSALLSVEDWPGTLRRHCLLRPGEMGLPQAKQKGPSLDRVQGADLFRLANTMHDPANSFADLTLNGQARIEPSRATWSSVQRVNQKPRTTVHREDRGPTAAPFSDTVLTPSREEHAVARPEFALAHYFYVLSNWLPSLWCAWTFPFLTCFMVRACRLRGRIGGRLLTEGRERHLLDDILRKKSIRRDVNLICSPHVDEPLAFGVLQWTIVLPTESISDLDAECESLLAHELAHLVRRDVIWLWFGRCLCGVFPFQILNRVAVSHWRTSAEFLADQWAVRAGIDPYRLASCLAHLAETRLQRPSPCLASSAGGRRSVVVSRVSQLLDNPLPDETRIRPLRRLILTTAATVGLALALVTSESDLFHSVDAANTIARAGGLSQGDDVAASRVANDLEPAWSSLVAEYELLSQDLSYVAELVRSDSSSAETRDLADQIQQRAEFLGSRIASARVGVLHRADVVDDVTN